MVGVTADSFSELQCCQFSNFVAIFSDFPTPFETFFRSLGTNIATSSTNLISVLILPTDLYTSLYRSVNLLLCSDGKMKLCEAPRLPLNCIVKRFITQSFSRRCTLTTSCGQKVEIAAFASQATQPVWDFFR